MATFEQSPFSGKFITPTSKVGGGGDLQLSIEMWLDDTNARHQLGLTREEIAEQKKGIEEVEEKTKASFNMVMSSMRTTYLMLTGLGRVMGGGMTMMFRTIYTVGMSAVGTYKALAAAAAASGPWGWAQAAIMYASTFAALGQLSAVMRGQTELTQTMRGYYMMLHGVSGLLGSFSM